MSELMTQVLAGGPNVRSASTQKMAALVAYTEANGIRELREPDYSGPDAKLGVKMPWGWISPLEKLDASEFLRIGKDAEDKVIAVIPYRDQNNATQCRILSCHEVIPTGRWVGMNHNLPDGDGRSQEWMFLDGSPDPLWNSPDLHRG